jgi:hypothetical protein
MTAPADIRTDFTVLDQHITKALCALRLARSASSQGKTRARGDAERVSEENLNALLDYRNAARRH